MTTRDANITALVAAAARLGNGQASEAISLLCGALMVACSRTLQPAAIMQIAIDSLEMAQAKCMEAAS